jgi:hypothetical protein
MGTVFYARIRPMPAAGPRVDPYAVSCCPVSEIGHAVSMLLFRSNVPLEQYILQCSTADAFFCRNNNDAFSVE